MGGGRVGVVWGDVATGRRYRRWAVADRCSWAMWRRRRLLWLVTWQVVVVVLVERRGGVGVGPRVLCRCVLAYGLCGVRHCERLGGATYLVVSPLVDPPQSSCSSLKGTWWALVLRSGAEAAAFGIGAGVR